MDNNFCFLNGLKTYAFPNRSELLDALNGQKKILVAINAEKILKKDDKLKDIINDNIGYPDGVGAVWALQRKGIKSVKIPGVELWLDIVGKFYKEKSFYLVGSSQQVVTNTVELLREDYPEIDIKNYRNGYLNETEFNNLKADILKMKPSIIFVAMGTPRQELLMQELMLVHPALYMGLGGSFDVYSGFKQRAPKFFQKHHLEWLYRLLKEPTRIKRQFILSKFLLLLSIKKL